MSKVLCVYYSRTGHTRRTMRDFADQLDAELVELRDTVQRSGWKGWLRCGMDAMRRGTCPLRPYTTEYPLSEYDLVILGTPVWAGRCSSVMRGFLKRHGKELERVAYVVLQNGEKKQRAVYAQMDLYVAKPFVAAVSLKDGSVGYPFWHDRFLQQVREYLAKREES